MNRKINELKQKSMDWLSNNLEFIEAGDDIEVATPLIGAYGDMIYCWIEKIDGYWRISDDSYLLFKLDPNQEDLDFYSDAGDVVIGSGFEFDDDSGEIFCEVENEDEIPQALNDLAQLQIALTYLKN
ncbi:hypothetical protein J2Z60_001133 [Lactobacillus colini]|uniref:DUF1828 domain-containing protein n=1 Tax=Lactobacillus colini TaxID=1819254 RepID=A0ABS4MEA2_9LACO|nr:DUF1828 domain-containing protein [Lactobacillus colini]MBP2057958.1 hypothetical protein [Lactobacillus colini]